MNRRSTMAFLALVLLQAGHSVEEYFTRLYDVLAPAHFVSDLLSVDRRIGFVAFNVTLVAFGLWCVFGSVRGNLRAAPALAWFWAGLELSNGLAHIAWAISARAYRPGLATAPLLTGAALVLAWRLRQSGSVRRAAA